MFKRRGIVIHPEDLDATWPERLHAARLNTLGIHPAGGSTARLSLEAALHHRLLPETEALIRQLGRQGVTVEYEAHTLSWLLPRELFSIHLEWFRMDETGVRTPDVNLCPSSREGLDFVEKRAEQLARMLDTGSDRYFFWLDDVRGGACHCEKCAGLTPGDQQMITVNAVLRGVRRFNRLGTVPYLAYLDAMAGPEKVAPLPGVILEYAPMLRRLDRPLFDPACAENAAETRHLPRLLSIFGREGAQALDYWADCSLYSQWKKPAVRLTLPEDVMRADLAAYGRLGFENVTGFGCYLDADYRARYGEPPIARYGALMAAQGRPAD